MASSDENAAEPAERTRDDRGRELHTRAFNPFELEENCFYVALGRMLSFSSFDVAGIAGRSEIDTTGIGMDFNKQAGIIELLTRITGRNIKPIYLQRDYLDDYSVLNAGDGPTIAKLLTVAKKHGLDNSCLAVEIFDVGSRMGHYISVYPSGRREWDAETDRPLYDIWDPSFWTVDDFQRHYAWDEVFELFSDAVVRIIIGSTNGAHNSIYGSSKNELELWLDTRRGVREGSRAESHSGRPDATWEASSGRWRLHGIYYPGCFGRGYCAGAEQSLDKKPLWRKVNAEQAIRGSWEYSFDSCLWHTIRFEEQLLSYGWARIAD